MYQNIGKRLFDLIITIPALVLLGPVYVAFGLLVWRNMGKPILFSQLRPGLDEKPFSLFKFRTMVDAFDAKGNILPDSERLTSFGIFLRRTSLDELPELFNVIRGDMSLVGPRPLLMRYLSRYTPEQARRHQVRPGITGWAQINGRNAIPWNEKFALDVWYVDNVSLWLDVTIIIRTFGLVFSRKNINQPGEATAREFFGNNQQDVSLAESNRTTSGGVEQ